LSVSSRYGVTGENSMEEHNQSAMAWRTPGFVLKLVGLLLLGAIIIVALVRDRIVGGVQAQVSVAGVGKVTYQPDQATVTVGVQVDKVFTADGALRQLNDKMGKVVAAIKAAGIEAGDIETQAYSLYPQYTYVNGVQLPAGYSANQQLSVKVRKLGDNNAQVSAVVAAATQAGANQVNGVVFGVSNLEDLKQQARVAAIADAKSKAGAQASAAGVRLGKILGWWENVVQSPDSQSFGGVADGKGGMGGGPAATPVVPSGNQEIIIQVSLNYRVR
jgi:uncharacterized protein YggE